jgi:hypothetical protein
MTDYLHMLVQLDPVFVKISDRVLIGSMHTKLIPPRYPQDQAKGCTHCQVWFSRCA